MTDPTNAVIPSVVIHVVNQATGVADDAETNNVGSYQVPGLFTGTYAISISGPNMKTYNRTLELLVAQNSVIDAAMTTGSVSQQVTVSANAKGVRPSSSAASPLRQPRPGVAQALHRF